MLKMDSIIEKYKTDKNNDLIEELSDEYDRLLDLYKDVKNESDIVFEKVKTIKSNIGEFYNISEHISNLNLFQIKKKE